MIPLIAREVELVSAELVTHDTDSISEDSGSRRTPTTLGTPGLTELPCSSPVGYGLRSSSCRDA
jgi:hypothetical protein